MAATQIEILEGEKITASIGTMVAMVSFAMLFASLFLGFAIYRLNSPVWPPMGITKPGLFFPLLSTVVIVTSSFFIEKFNRGLRKIDFFISLTLGVLFLTAQLYLWKDLHQGGLYASSGIYGSLIYTFTWIHAGHIVLGLVFLFLLSPLVIRGEFTNKNILKINSVTKFWHFLAIVWLLMLFFLFIF